MRAEFAKSVLQTLLDEGVLERDDSILAVCAADGDRELFLALGFTDLTLSNLDERREEVALPPFRWSRQDAHRLTFEDRSFDFAFVSAGIHHCSRPHAAILEMYRVARKGILVVEARDSLLMRTAQRLGLASAFEINPRLATTFTHGGVNNSHIPNHCYRWTEREFIKTLRSYDPEGEHTFRFFYGLSLPRRSAAQRLAGRLLRPATFVFERGLKKQCNDFAMLALRPRLPDDLWPWLQMNGDEVDLNHEYVTRLRENGRLPPE